MQQYFVNASLKINDEYIFDSEDAHHIKTVLRMKEGSVVRLVDENKKLFFANIKYRGSDVLAIPESLSDLNSEMSVKVTIVQGLIKGERWDYFLQKATELGVYRIVPYNAIRSVVKINDKIEKKVDRWQKIVAEASEQSKRLIVPEVTMPIKLNDIKYYLSDINIVAYEDVNFSGIKLKEIIKENKSVTLIIGPEGGLDIKEIQYFDEMGFKMITLGPRILRAETASTYALSAISSLVE